MKILAATYSKKLSICWLISILAIAACGRVGDPLPPIRQRTLVPEALKVFQRGEDLILSWPKPGVIAMENSRVVRAEILRRDEDANEPPRLPEQRFLEEARVVGSISVKEINNVELRILQFVDHLPLATLASDLRYRYAIRYVNAGGAPLPLSNYAFIEPLTAVARPPLNPQAEITQEAIKLSWQAPSNNIDDSAPALVIGYNVYRRTKNQPFAEQPINSTPITTTAFIDRQFKFGTEYFYTIRSLSQGKETPIESPTSVETSLLARDSFAPLAPSNVTGAAAAGIVSLFWPANTEPDLKGYLIYRAASRDQKREQWLALTPTTITTTTFRDERGEIGKTYFYFVIAVDQAGNQSEPSEATEVEVLQ